MGAFLSYHTFTEADLAPFAGLQQRYQAAYPCRTPTDGHVYLSPSFDTGRYVLCGAAVDGRLAAYAAFYPQGSHAWAHIQVEPGLPEDRAVRERLYSWLAGLAREQGADRLDFQYYPAEKDSIAFVQSQGGAYAYSIYNMGRPLDLPIPPAAALEGFEIRQTRMQSEDEQREFVATFNECFPEAPLSLEGWQYLVYSPWWAEGACITGRAGDVLAGSVSVYWEPGSRNGFTEYVFTRPAYRGRGLARVLLAESLRYLKDHGLDHALLEVKAENEKALTIYLELGYRVTAESQVWARIM